MAAVEPGNETDTMLQPIQRHLNTINDAASSVGTRRASLKALVRCPLWKHKDKALGLAIADVVLPLVMQRLADSSESCRVLALSLVLHHLVPLALHAQPQLLPTILPILHARIGTVPVGEPAEEVRLDLVRLVALVVGEANATTVHAQHQPLLDIITCMAQDAFHDIKVAIYGVVVGVAPRLAPMAEAWDADQATASQRTLLTAVAPGLRHQRSAVRKAALQAVSALIAHGGPALSASVHDILPLVALLTTDRVAAIRRAVVQEFYTWLSSMPELLAQDRATLLLHLLGCIVDDSEAVCNDAVTCMRQLGTKDDKHHAVRAPPTLLPPALHAHPITASTRSLVVGALPHMLPHILELATHWTEAQRQRAVHTLFAAVAYAGPRVRDHASSIIEYMVSHGVRDEAVDVRKIVARCGRLLGSVLTPAESLAALLPMLDKAVANDSGGDETAANAAARALEVLDLILQGTSVTGDAAMRHVTTHAATVVSFLETSGVLHDATSVSVCFVAASVLDGLVRSVFLSASSSSSSTALPLRLFVLLVKVDALAALHGRPGDVDIDSTLARFGGSAKDPVRAAFAQYFADAVRAIVGEAGVSPPYDVAWTKNGVVCSALFRLLARAVHAMPDHLDVVLPMLAACAGQADRPATRTRVLEAVYHLVQSVGPAGSLVDADVSLLIQRVLMPCLVWKAGRVASAIRLQAVSCMTLLFTHDLVSVGVVREVYDVLLPRLRSCIDDDEVETRLQVQRLLFRLFEMRDVYGVDAVEQNRHADEGMTAERDIALTELYRQVLGRLDDSDDRVRIAASCTIGSLVCRRFPPRDAFDVNRVHFAHVCRVLLVHLDDGASPAVVQAVGDCLVRIAVYDVAGLSQEAGVARAKHLSPAAVDAVLARVHAGEDTLS